ncbi:capsid protein [Notoacmeibacter ruber]|uniref:Capsid protein n=1 Tax=Notoacmeibacter ruber TaxID=2670375 RepID=A0A3L7JF09_9HYPH|nr:capsid protein [Notoacmeibacter ruber]RLQ88909.1 capsid protein [Notoacmeibacter ruber]
MAPNRPFPVDPALTAFAIGYRNPSYMFIADDVLPRVPVMGERFSWTEYPLKEGFRAPDNRVGRTGRINRVEFSGERRESAVEDFGLEAPIPLSDINEAARMRAQGLGNFDPRQRAVMGIEDYNQINREIRVAKLVQDPASYPTSQKMALSGTDQLSDYDNSDPIGLFRHILDSTLVFRPNQLTMGHEAWTTLSGHPKLINAVKGGLTTEGMITRQQLADLLELPRGIKVGSAYMDAARLGQDADIQRVWGRSMVFQFINATADANAGTITHGFTATYGSKISGSLPDPNVGLEGGETVRSGERVKELICAPGVSFLLQDAVAPRI